MEKAKHKWYWSPIDENFQIILPDEYLIIAKGLTNPTSTEVRVYRSSIEAGGENPAYMVVTHNSAVNGPEITREKGNPNELLDRKEVLTGEGNGLSRRANQGLLRVISLVEESVS